MDNLTILAPVSATAGCSLCERWGMKEAWVQSERESEKKRERVRVRDCLIFDNCERFFTEAGPCGFLIFSKW
jgi:hypothetical protein